MSELRARPVFAPQLIHTGQHFSADMSDSFFRELEIPEPDVNLGVGSGTHAGQTAQVMLRLEPVFCASRPDALLVVGDVNSTAAAAIVASKMGIPVAHVEAGLRSFDRTMPEEINRILTDAVSDYLFTTEPGAERNLLAEGIPKQKIFFTGNVMIDTLLRFREKAARSRVLERLGLAAGSYAVVTLHRPSNVDDAAGLCQLISMLAELGRRLPVVFPVHPRTRARMASAGIAPCGLILTEPMGYLDFLRLIGGSRLVLTDSGGIQEETTILGVPCLTLRDNTERPVTIEMGTNRLVGTNPAAALKFALETLDAAPRPAAPPPLWDGKASGRIVDVLERSLASQ
jgi:UDP-N-acetylglucosamine 2-epimerase (non-hydrolysing)